VMSFARISSRFLPAMHYNMRAISPERKSNYSP
jgi:hypothetical protein